MVNIFHVLALILCCNRIKEAQEERRIDQIIREERRIMKEWNDKNKPDKLEVQLPNYKEFKFPNSVKE